MEGQQQEQQQSSRSREINIRIHFSLHTQSSVLLTCCFVQEDDDLTQTSIESSNNGQLKRKAGKALWKKTDNENKNIHWERWRRDQAMNANS